MNKKNDDKIQKIGIVGLGFVGSAVYNAIPLKSNIIVYDKYKKGYDKNLKSIKSCEYIFTCLPTLENPDGTQCFDAYEIFFKEMKGYNGIIIIKSTVLYSNIKKYIDKFNIVMNPEFLNQNTAYDDFKKEKVVILGGRIDHVDKVCKLYNSRIGKSHCKYEFCTHEEAINVKYIHNNYHAYKVLFWNMVNETTHNTRKIFDLYSKITGNKNEMSQISLDGKLGYGGACFPKDVSAFLQEHSHELTQFMQDYNNKLRNTNKKYTILKNLY